MCWEATSNKARPANHKQPMLAASRGTHSATTSPTNHCSKGVAQKPSKRCGATY